MPQTDLGGRLAGRPPLPVSRSSPEMGQTGLLAQGAEDAHHCFPRRAQRGQTGLEKLEETPLHQDKQMRGGRVTRPSVPQTQVTVTDVYTPSKSPKTRRAGRRPRGKRQHTDHGWHPHAPRIVTDGAARTSARTRQS